MKRHFTGIFNHIFVRLVISGYHVGRAVHVVPHQKTKDNDSKQNGTGKQQICCGLVGALGAGICGQVFEGDRDRTKTKNKNCQKNQKKIMKTEVQIYFSLPSLVVAAKPTIQILHSSLVELWP
jgi:hypothetical protein